MMGNLENVTKLARNKVGFKLNSLSKPGLLFRIYLYKTMYSIYSLVAQLVKNLPAIQETQVRPQGWEDTLEEGMATHSSILAWRIPWMEEPGGKWSMGSQTDTNEHTHRHIYKTISSSVSRYLKQYNCLFHFEKKSKENKVSILFCVKMINYIHKKLLLIADPAHYASCFALHTACLTQGRQG